LIGDWVGPPEPLVLINKHIHIISK